MTHSAIAELHRADALPPRRTRIQQDRQCAQGEQYDNENQPEWRGDDPPGPIDHVKKLGDGQAERHQANEKQCETQVHGCHLSDRRNRFARAAWVLAPEC